MRIIHFSDWHNDFSVLPEADLYVCTGDMMPDNMNAPAPSPYKYKHYNERFQKEWQALTAEHDPPFTYYLGSPRAPIVCVRGNHDYADLAPMFQGCNLIHEFLDNEVIELLGLRITGHRGVPYISGYFSDEFMRADLLDRVRAMPEADLILTHYPPGGMLDNDWGLSGMQAALIKKMKPTSVHMFGHIHECGGRIENEGDGRFSNAATTFNVIDL